MSALPTLAILASLASLLARRRARTGSLTLDDVALSGALHLAILGVLATLLAWAGWFSATSLTLVGVGVAVAAWPWRVGRVPTRPREPSGRVHTLFLLGLLLFGVALRTPSIPAPLAGRDQGTYVLRAALTERTGGLGFTDELLARAGREQAEDLLGLYPKTDEPWRAARYEAAYRPGTYLASRDRGEVVPQFFHVHPMLLACERAAFGEAGGTGRLAMPWQSGLWLLAMACIARRLWPRGPWAALALGLIASSPLAIWTGRTPLSETTMALFEWSAVLVALRMRSGEEPASDAPCWLAGLLAATAWVRGNALLVLPLALAIVWLRPREGETRAHWLLLGGVFASVVVHALTVFPYLHDELLRRVPDVHVGPWALIGVTAIGVVGWTIVDRGFGDPRLASLRARVLTWLPRAWVAVTLLAFGLWWVWREEAGDALKPFSRLDPVLPLLGMPLLIFAMVGLIMLARRWQPHTMADTWLVAIASALPVTALLYAPRNLPGLGLFYYGRYLVPELLPCAVLAAVAAIAWSVEAMGRVGLIRKIAAWTFGLVASVGLAWSVASPLITNPRVLLREYEAAAPAIDWLASRIPDRAIVIAGGEGWHHGHTYNQVGGALALGEGVQVLPYRTRESAWASAWEILVAAPQRRGQPAPELFLLVNEAAHHHRRADGQRVALLDDLLWAPFVIERVDLLELFLHALTPVDDAMPSRVARHELRMGLMKITVDPTRIASIERIVPAGDRCLDPVRPLTIELEPGSTEVAHLVLVAAPGTAQTNPHWRVELDGEALALEPLSGLRPHPRATLGPYPLRERPRTITILAAESSVGPGRCPHGELAELRLLPRERAGLVDLDTRSIVARTFEPLPLPTLAKPIEPVTWVGGRSLTRHRPGIHGTDEVVGEALVLIGGATLEFPPVDLPLDREGRPLPLDVVISLASSDAHEGARLHVRVDDRTLGTIELPSPRRAVWPAPALVWVPTTERAQLRLEFEASTAERVLVRDVALFVSGPGIASVD